MFKSLYELLSPAGQRARLAIFIFHRVLPKPDPLLPWEIEANHFERICSFISRNYQVITLSEAGSRLSKGTLPAAAACITFDDGYADNITVAAPILKRYGLTATFFVATGFIDGGRMWNDSIIEAVRLAPQGVLDLDDLGIGCQEIDDIQSRVQAYRSILAQLKYLNHRERCEIADVVAQRLGLESDSCLMMTRTEVVALKEMGMEIGGHTVSHPILAGLSEREAMKEIGEGREQLAEWLGNAPKAFAYPNGTPGRDYTVRDVELVRRAGYELAVSTEMAIAVQKSSIYQLPRFTPWDDNIIKFGLRCGFATSKSYLK